MLIKRVQMIRFSTTTSPIGALIRLSSGKLSKVMTHGARLQARRPMISVIRYVNSVSPASYLSILATPDLHPMGSLNASGGARLTPPPKSHLPELFLYEPLPVLDSGLFEVGPRCAGNWVKSALAATLYLRAL